jgi:hypothetical protein
VDEFMENPTDVLLSYMARRPANNAARDGYMLRMGRIAMGMEVITVIKLLEEHEYLLDHANEAIAVLTTLLTDQGLMEEAQQWYHHLSEWRKIKLYDAVADASDRTAGTSTPDPRLDAELPRGHNGAQPGSDRSRDPS